MTKLYYALDPVEGTEAQFAAVHLIRWRSEWGEPKVLFREVDRETQILLEAASDLLAACKADKAYIRHIHLCPQCRTGNYCQEGMQLWAKAGDLRDRAIAKAEEA